MIVHAVNIAIFLFAAHFVGQLERKTRGNANELIDGCCHTYSRYITQRFEEILRKFNILIFLIGIIDVLNHEVCLPIQIDLLLIGLGIREIVRVFLDIHYSEN